MSNWISVNDRMPELHQIVALAHNDRWMNTGSAFEEEGCNWYGAGYMCEWGTKFWSVFGETRAQSLDSVTHWMPLEQVRRGHKPTVGTD